jgi:hypothetical protein
VSWSLEITRRYSTRSKRNTEGNRPRSLKDCTYRSAWGLICNRPRRGAKILLASTQLGAILSFGFVRPSPRCTTERLTYAPTGACPRGAEESQANRDRLLIFDPHELVSWVKQIQLLLRFHLTPLKVDECISPPSRNSREEQSYHGLAAWHAFGSDPSVHASAQNGQIPCRVTRFGIRPACALLDGVFETGVECLEPGTGRRV